MSVPDLVASLANTPTPERVQLLSTMTTSELQCVLDLATSICNAYSGLVAAAILVQSRRMPAPTAESPELQHLPQGQRSEARESAVLSAVQDLDSQISDTAQELITLRESLSQTSQPCLECESGDNHHLTEHMSIRHKMEQLEGRLDYLDQQRRGLLSHCGLPNLHP